MVRVVGLEPTSIAALEPKSSMSANSIIPAYFSPHLPAYIFCDGTAIQKTEFYVFYHSLLLLSMPKLDKFRRRAALSVGIEKVAAAARCKIR